MPLFGKYQKIERTVVAIGLKQPVETEQAGKKCAYPENCRTESGQEIEVGADTEGNGRDHREKEQDARERTAAGANPEANIANEES